MILSTRNQLKGLIASITEGVVNSEVIIQLPESVAITSVITNGAVKNLDLVVGEAAIAFFKASSVIIGIDIQQISARNVFTGKVSAIIDGAVNDEVSVDLGNGFAITSVITKASTIALGLSIGKEVSAIIKASSVSIAVD